jgi:hypothetical protein
LAQIDLTMMPALLIRMSSAGKFADHLTVERFYCGWIAHVTLECMDPGQCMPDRIELIFVVASKDHRVVDGTCSLTQGRYHFFPRLSVPFAFPISSGQPRSGGWRTINPVLALGREEIDVDRVFGADELVWRVRRDDENHPCRHHKLPALRGDLASALGNPGGLLIGVVVQRELQPLVLPSRRSGPPTQRIMNRL